MTAYDITHQILRPSLFMHVLSALGTHRGWWQLVAEPTVSRRTTRIAGLLLLATQPAPPALLPRLDCPRLRTLLGALVPADAQLAAAARAAC